MAALSAGEILAALDHAQGHDIADFTPASHSFELLSHNPARINQIVRRRFEMLCTTLNQRRIASVTCSINPPVVKNGQAPVLPAA